MQLTGKQNEVLLEALCDAFRYEFQLEELAKHELNINLQSITDSKNIRIIAYNLIDELERKERLVELMKGALKKNPENAKLKLAVAAIFLYEKFTFMPFKQEYSQQIKDSYIACYGSMHIKYDSNEDQTDNILEFIFNFQYIVEVTKEKKSNPAIELESLMKFAAYFLIKSKTSTTSHLNDLKNWCVTIDKNFLDILKEIENNYNKYYEALLSLNFYKQVHFFQQIVNKNSIGACIIHGKQGSGQRWLLHRLIREIPNESKNKAKLIWIDMGMFAPKVERIFAQISRYLNRVGQLSENEIISGICNCWKTQNVIINFKVNDISEQNIKEFINKFWSGLVKQAQNFDAQSNKFKLFMFLIDEKDCVGQWTILELRDSFDNNWKPDLLIKLPLIENLSWQELNDWINNYKHMLPENLTKLDKSDIQSLVNEWDSGLFMTVLPKICDICDSSLYSEYIEKCLNNSNMNN
jgi:hypothetical protein